MCTLISNSEYACKLGKFYQLTSCEVPCNMQLSVKIAFASN